MEKDVAQDEIKELAGEAIKGEVNEEAKGVDEAELEKIIKNHVLMSMGAGLVPVPIFDFVAVSGIQLDMIRKIAQMYDIPFSKDKVKNITASLIGGAIPASSGGILASLLKTVPIVGQTTGALSFSAIAGATTYAIGRVMVQHFASGGTFLNFKPDEVKAHFKEMFKRGEKIASEIKN